MAARRLPIGQGAVIAAMIVAGCAGAPIPGSPFVGCDAVPPGAFDSVDWDSARRINVRIRHGEFQPSLIRLYQDRPYVMRIENRDRSSRRFQAADFFAAVYVHSLITPDGTRSVSCPWGIGVAPGEVAEVRFVAARDGRYAYRDDLLPFMFGGIPDGIVHIEPAPNLAALMPPAIPGITKPDEDIPTGPYAPASVPVAPPAPETPAMPTEPAALPVVPPQPDAPQPAPVEPVTLPLPLPAPETPAVPAEPAALPVVPPALETPAMPTEPAALPIVPPAPETPALPAEPAALPVVRPAPETPAMPTEPAALPVVPPAPETPAMPTEPAALPVVRPAPEAPPTPAEPAALSPVPPVPETPATPAAPKTLVPPPARDAPFPVPPAPENIPAPSPGGVGLFGQ
jgi:hypothetical protein